MKLKRVEYHKFKAFSSFTLRINEFNILVGPNNAGKSTIITSFRILELGFRRANSKKPTRLEGPDGNADGYDLDLKGTSVARENIFYNYDESEAAHITFYFDGDVSILLYFPERSVCRMFANGHAGHPKSPKYFTSEFPFSIGFVPILGPVEQTEKLVQFETARQSLYNYTASRNFRNIWHHFPDLFDEFKAIIQETWPGMDINYPETEFDENRNRVLYMFCPEERYPRELFWTGFGFQIWCQIISHILLNEGCDFFLIDEPDIYLHSSLQRQLLEVLKDRHECVLIATHSTEIITEADQNEIVLIDKKRRHSKRLNSTKEIESIFLTLGSNLNPVLTHLAKTKKVVFVEGKDYQLLSKFAKKLNKKRVASRADFSVIPLEGFQPLRLKILIEGFETALGDKIQSFVIFDKDYRTDKECLYLKKEFENFVEHVHFHNHKEIENYLLSESAIAKCIWEKFPDKLKRKITTEIVENKVKQIITKELKQLENVIEANYLEFVKKFHRDLGSKDSDSTIFQSCFDEIKPKFQDYEAMKSIAPGKKLLKHVLTVLQNDFRTSISPNLIMTSFTKKEVHGDIVHLIDELNNFRK